MIRILLVDDHRLVRVGIRKLLEPAADIDVVGEAGSGAEALDLVTQLSPDVVLMDKNMPGMDGMEAARKILRQGRSRVIYLTVQSTGPWPRKMLDAGAHGFLTKSCGLEEMLEAIRAVHAGKRYLSSEIARLLADESLDGAVDSSPFAQLSERELQVMHLTIGGRRANEISEHLHLSPKTVSTYRSRVFQKTGAANDAELVRLAITHGLVSADSPEQI